MKNFIKALHVWRIKRRYAFTGILLQAYFFDDFDIYGDTVEEIVASYRECYRDNYNLLRAEAEELLLLPDSELAERMALLAENQFDPELWGETWRSFLLRVLAALE
ncbi:contact-dependent growth inhibition system immunity protein [Mixta calida]|uniref:contact-dependent growth inhibition system immunity protein n=1 Tax=Mixta calida TaxID=665913 RepID=UPI0034D4569A